MIESIWVKTQYGDYLNLNMRNSGSTYGIAIFNIEGLGSPNANIGGSGGPSFDGTRINSVRTDPRQIIVSLAVTARGDKEETAKELIYRFFPIKQPIIFGVTTGNRQCYIEGIVESNVFNQFAQTENAVISLNCPNPYFKDVDVQEYSLGLNIGFPRFSFPFSNESLVYPLIELGIHQDVPSTEIAYFDGVETGLDIYLAFTGPATEISITNINGNQVMVIDPSISVQSGDSIHINTKIGEKSVTLYREEQIINIINSITVNTRWLTVKQGLNTIRLTATTGLDNIICDLAFTPLRQGV